MNEGTKLVDNKTIPSGKPEFSSSVYKKKVAGNLPFPLESWAYKLPKTNMQKFQ